jgi:site-specific DNA-methyltransferase (adenine-specific)
MKEIEDKSIDLILCDLPYEVTNRQEWDVGLPLNELWSEYERIIKNKAAIILTAVEPFRSKLIASNFKLFKYDLIWEKNKTFGFLNAKKQPLRKHESILVFYKQQPVYNPQKTQGHKPVNKFTHHDDGMNYGITKKVSGGGQTDRYPTSILYFPVVNNDSPEKYHPAQKPLALFEYLILTYTNPGNLVLDNCIGSGTTAIACIKTNRQYIGMEKDEHYYKICLERIKKGVS